MSRMWDVATTTINIYSFGYSPEIEANPLMRVLMIKGYGWFIAYQILFALVASWALARFRYGRPILIALTIISLLVGTANLAIFLMVG